MLADSIGKGEWNAVRGPGSGIILCKTRTDFSHVPAKSTMRNREYYRKSHKVTGTRHALVLGLRAHGETLHGATLAEKYVNSANICHF